jgi:Tfp pilus assembly protein PilO
MTSTGDLVQRILAERRGVIVPLALVALVNLGFYALAVYPLSLKVSASEQRAVAARAQLAVADRENKDVRSTLRLTEQASKDLGRFYDDILPADLTIARRQTYEHLAALAREHNLAIPRRAYRVDEGYKGRLERLNIGMELTGDYADMRDFIYDLETSPEFVAIEGIALAEDTQKQDALTLSLSLSTYYRGGERGN